MNRAFHRSKTTGWIFLAAAAVFASISGAIVVSVARYGLDRLMNPIILLFAATPLAFAVPLGMMARAHLRHHPVMVSVSDKGVSFAELPPIPWAEVDAVISIEAHFGYGPYQFLTIRRRFTPSDIAAKRAEWTMHDLFTDRTIAPSMADSTVDDMLAEFDAAMGDAGFCRAEPPVKRFRLAQSTTTWKIRPLDPNA